jgi:hypothetical protein
MLARLILANTAKESATGIARGFIGSSLLSMRGLWMAYSLLPNLIRSKRPGVVR